MTLLYLKCLKKEKVEFGIGHDRLSKDLDDLNKAHKALEREFSNLTKSHEQLQIQLSKYDVPNSSSFSCDHAIILEENASLKEDNSLYKETNEQLQASYLKDHAMFPSSLDIANVAACDTSSTYCEASNLQETVKLRPQLDFLSSKYGKLDESHEKL